ncbi:MAG: isoleucine--tRNA ligase [Tenericutes bacterium]|nr:isoleucine--tRNA ligase [Mycoplasmatota bacterium]
MKIIFEELEKGRISEIEDKISDKWEKEDILNKTINNREGKENFVFYEGPPTANGMPGIHHVVSRILKDTVCKYQTMKGKRVVRKAGWDTHGLPVEIEVEKQLGLKSKKEIEEFGIKEFNEKCKESVFKNKDAFSLMTKKMGYFIDLDNPYVTFDNNYIETEWWILNKFFKEGLIYEGHKILPYCTRCGTGLASHEVAQGYKEVNTDTVIATMKVKNKDEYFLVWTTTPWTLLSNVALAVNPNETYVKVKSQGYTFILAKSLTHKVLGDDIEVLEELNGKDLEYIEYEQLIPELKVNKKAFYVTLADYVTTEDGTGIVHIAPAFGEDDYQVGRKYDLPVLNPVGEDGKYTEGPWKDILVFDADVEIIKYLKENNKLFKKERVLHNYPHCWRCDTPLLYYAKPSWYIEMTKLKDKLIDNNNSVNWHPSFIGEKRFGNWLENLNDWAISRTRYWGTPLNIWKCECGHIESIASIEELINKSIEKIDNTIDLHRPFVDEIHIKCPKCNKTMTRVKEVIDCWFDSGSMPFSQYHYPFENKELFESQFPADFICEGIDQTRGWFYSLIAISTFVKGVSPYKNVLVNDLLLDKNGQKMSKSKGNAVDPFKMFDEYGADVLRWYLLYVSPTWLPTKFDIEGLKEVQSKMFNTLKNTYTFFQLYANTDRIDPRTYEIDYEDREEIDKWLLSKYNRLVMNTDIALKEYDLNRAVKHIQLFLNDDLSNWYIRRNRRRFWDSELNNSKKAVYKTTYEVLLGLTKLMAPIIPFITEDLYKKLTNNDSVHLEDYPIYNKKHFNDHLEEKMDLVRDLITLGRFAREEAKIKVRQPISNVIINGKYKSLIGDLVDLIKEELNVKEVIFENNLNKYMNFEVKPNFKEAGPIFGSNIKLFQEYLSKISEDDLNKLEVGDIQINIDNKNYIINKNMIDIRISSKEGYNAQMQNNKFIILDTNLTQNLINEGVARELVSKIQQLRKTNNYNVIDRINIYYDSKEDFEIVLNEFKEYISKDTLAINITKRNINNKLDLNGLEVGLEIERVENYK